MKWICNWYLAYEVDLYPEPRISDFEIEPGYPKTQFQILKKVAAVDIGEVDQIPAG